MLNSSPLTPSISIVVASNAVVSSAFEVKAVLLTEVRSCDVGLSKQADGLGCSFSRFSSRMLLKWSPYCDKSCCTQLADKPSCEVVMA